MPPVEAAAHGCQQFNHRPAKKTIFFFFILIFAFESNPWKRKLTSERENTGSQKTRKRRQLSQTRKTTKCSPKNVTKGKIVLKGK